MNFFLSKLNIFFFYLRLFGGFDKFVFLMKFVFGIFLFFKVKFFISLGFGGFYMFGISLSFGMKLFLGLGFLGLLFQKIFLLFNFCIVFFFFFF